MRLPGSRIRRLRTWRPGFGGNWNRFARGFAKSSSTKRRRRVACIAASNLAALSCRIAKPGDKIGEKRVVTITSFGMILDREGEGIIAKPDLLDDVVGGAPGFNFESVSEFIEGLVMRAVDLVEPMRRGTIGAEGLDIVILHFRRVMAGNVEVQGAAERDI